MSLFFRFIMVCFLLLVLILPFNSQAQNHFLETQSKNYVTLSAGIDQLKEQFNRDQGKTRLLMVLSPG
ncbi:MAG: hypothetical protein HY819_02395 [Acidobacteria bacterium]|nr:hypothetical protein [Acidobacteriota bacterium]